MFGLTTALHMLQTLVDANTRPVDRYPFVFDKLPSGASFGAPYVGNGDIGVVFYVSSLPGTSGKHALSSGDHVFSMGKNDLWTSEGSK